MTTGPLRAAGGRAPSWVLYLLLGSVAASGYLTVAIGETRWQRATAGVLFTGVGLSAAVALLVGACRHPARDQGPWLLLASSQLACLAADAIFSFRQGIFSFQPGVVGRTTLPSAADLTNALHYPLLVGALVLLIRRRSQARDRAAVVDATIVAVAVGLLAWVFIAEPRFTPGMTPWLRAGMLYQPLLDTVVLALTLTLAMGGGRRTLPLGLLVAGMTLTVATNSVFGILQASAGPLPVPGSCLAAGRLAAYLLLGACGLHPSTTRLAQPFADRMPIGRFRLGMLTIASLTAPALVIVTDRLGRPADVLACAVTCTLLGLLVHARLSGLVSSARAAAVTDDLTGLANRAMFLARVRAGMTQARRNDTHIAVLFLDVDRFKMINDALGHAAGDQLLVTVADRLDACLRGGDTAARHGGGDFTVLLTQLASEADAAEAAERVRGALNRPLVVAGQRVECSVSIGVAVDVDLTDAAEDLLRHADAALYRAKDGGRNRVALFDEASRTFIQTRISEEVELRDGIEKGQFEAWFQPIVDMPTGRIVGAEALARWIHPEHGVLAPGRFIPLAVDSGMISTLSQQVALQAVDLRRAITPLVDPQFRLSFNLGIGEFDLVQIIHRIMGAAAAAGTAPCGLTLEILETSVINDVEAAGRALSRAREQGFAVSLDDFGTGYSSLSLLRDLPLDSLKIDRTFVHRMADSPADAAIVRSVVDLATHLGLGVVAEGVETDDDVQRLLWLRATRGQGFRYAPAVPASEFVGWLRGTPPWLYERDLVSGDAVR